MKRRRKMKVKHFLDDLPLPQKLELISLAKKILEPQTRRPNDDTSIAHQTVRNTLKWGLLEINSIWVSRN